MQRLLLFVYLFMWNFYSACLIESDNKNWKVSFCICQLLIWAKLILVAGMLNKKDLVNLPEVLVWNFLLQLMTRTQNVVEPHHSPHSVGGLSSYMIKFSSSPCRGLALLSVAEALCDLLVDILHSLTASYQLNGCMLNKFR